MGGSVADHNEVRFQVGRRRKVGKGNGEGVTTRTEGKPGERGIAEQRGW